MEDEKDPSPYYIVGFNQGYLMKENLPDVVSNMLANNINNKSDRMNGMRAGARQYEVERFKKDLARNRNNSQDRQI